MNQKDLLKGFDKFRQKFYEESNLMPNLVKKGAHPDFFVIHCIDPRSGADLVFNAEPGTMFGDRVMASIVPPYDDQDPRSDFRASLTYAVDVKKVKELIVLGHTECGGIEALVTSADIKDISNWMSVAKPALEAAKKKVGDKDVDALCRETERQSVVMTLKNLMTYPPVRKAAEEGRLSIRGWLFDMKHGAIHAYNKKTDAFEVVAGSKALKGSNHNSKCGCGHEHTQKKKVHRP